MTARSGIQVHDTLKETFDGATCDDSIRALKFQIHNSEEFEIEDRTSNESDPQADWDAVRDILDDTNACYVLMKRHDVPGKWMCIAWVPSDTHPRMKLLYASSRESLKHGLGGESFTDDYFITVKNECSYQAFTRFHDPEHAPDVRTWQEATRLNAAIESKATSVKQSVMATLDIPVFAAASDALSALQSGSANLAILSLDFTREEIGCEESSSCDLASLEGKLSNTPLFVLYRYDHTRNGESMSKTIFVYYCPNSARPKLKMFYSTCKSNIVDLCQQYQIQIDMKMEISIPNEVSQNNILQELYPQIVHKEKFSKPTRPGRRGNSRLR
eukprot:755269_1